MKAIRISAPVGVEGLVYEDAPDPEPAIGDVLVKVHACGFTASELFWPLYTDRAGRDRTPLIPGHEFSGVVVGLGYGTAGVAVGDEVYGLIDGYRDGGAAELIAIETRDVAPAPTTIDHVQAASLPQAGLTSWQALFDHGRLTAGQTVMIHGAAGAVGSIAVQLAKTKGARVVGTGRSGRRSVPSIRWPRRARRSPPSRVAASRAGSSCGRDACSLARQCTCSCRRWARSALGTRRRWRPRPVTSGRLLPPSPPIFSTSRCLHHRRL
jgi:D-arabinose 1-dehydrogenase-like Zn-dependent alcohol dehydrogenase